MILTLQREEINGLIKSAVKTGVELEIVELGEDRAVIELRKGVMLRIALTGFTCRDNIISARLESRLLTGMLFIAKPFLEKYSISLRDDRISYRLPDNIQEIMTIKRVSIASSSMTFEGDLIVDGL